MYMILLQLLHERQILLRSARNNLHLITNIPSLIHTLTSCIFSCHYVSNYLRVSTRNAEV